MTDGELELIKTVVIAQCKSSQGYQTEYVDKKSFEVGMEVAIDICFKQLSPMLDSERRISRNLEENLKEIYQTINAFKKLLRLDSNIDHMYFK